MYKVIYKRFRDLEDETEHEYVKGNIFPYDAREISKERLETLLTANNKIGVPLIILETEEDKNDLSKKKSLELKEIAGALGLEFKAVISNADLIKMIEEATKTFDENNYSNADDKNTEDNNVE